MRRAHADHVLRHCLRSLAERRMACDERHALLRSLRGCMRHAQRADAEDLAQGFLLHLLGNTLVLEALLRVPVGSLEPVLRRCFRQHRSDEFRRTDTGRVAKALDDVLRRRDGRFRGRGRLLFAGPAATDTAMPVSVLATGAEGLRLDHGRLGAAAAAMLRAEGGGFSRPELARRLARLFDLDRVAWPDAQCSANDDACELVVRLDMERLARRLAASLGGRDRLVLRDALDGRPLREAGPRAGLGTTGVHLARRELGRRIDRFLLDHGYGTTDRLALLGALERRLAAEPAAA